MTKAEIKEMVYNCVDEDELEFVIEETGGAYDYAVGFADYMREDENLSEEDEQTIIEILEEYASMPKRERMKIWN